MVRKLSSQGFTLPELLLTALILAYAISMLLLLFINTTSLNEVARNLTTATTHAEYVMESIKNTAFANIKTNINNNLWTWNTAGVTAAGLVIIKNESITTTVSGTNPLTVTVTVSWNDTGGRTDQSRCVL